MAYIMLVEDDKDMRDLLETVIAMKGHEVSTAGDGVEALILMDLRFPQLVVTDVEMPRLDGPAMIYRMFIENLGRENIPTILISANVELPRIAEVVGTPYYLAKPFEIQSLTELIEVGLVEAQPPRPLGCMAR